jgi:Mrp family chromosome partitioning ATPase
MLSEDQIREVLRNVQDPELGRDIVSLGMVRQVEVRDGAVSITLALTTLECPLKEQIVEDVRAAVLALDETAHVGVELTQMPASEREQLLNGAYQSTEGKAAHLNKIGRVLAVMSGKGGVGKSLVTAMIATELRRRGLRVGIMDADITGPSIPKMLGLSGRPHSGPIGIAPVRSRKGIAVMSINLLLPNEDDAVIWRGPLVAGAVKQFWTDVFWGTLDYLLVDMPPGTSDVPLTVMQSLPLNGIILVTSPQDLASMVVRKAAHMVSQLEVPILGIIENMSYAICPHCGQQYELFGHSHVQGMSTLLGVPLLARIPLDSAISTLTDEGCMEDYQMDGFAQVIDQLLWLVPEKATTPKF